MVEVGPRVHIALFIDKVVEALFSENGVNFFPDLSIGIKKLACLLVNGIAG
jgi:hypothetical protein